MAAPSQRTPASPRRWWICAGLVLLTAAVFFPVVQYPFVNFDDTVYVLRNPHVLGGLKWANIVWSFQGKYASNWHPVTWMSHMLDCQLFGTRAGWHHLTNLVLHAANVALLFWLLARITGAVWRSAVVAALFAIHPLHVESVAWVAERKDVLSGFFFLLTMGAYVFYLEKTRQPTPPVEAKRGKTVSKVARERAAVAGRSVGNSRAATWYLLSLVFLALGLMSKPMLVTVPFVLLLLDYWPLRRVKAKRPPEAAGVSATVLRPVSAGRLVLEKLPYFVLVIVSCLLTMTAQKRGGAMLTFNEFPLQLRIENAVVSLARYLGKTIWPGQLSVFYPHPVHWPMWLATGAGALVVMISIAAFAWRRRLPYLFTGWFWFFGMLMPVIGIVQVGSQSMADRYMYLPAIGLFLAGIWGAYALIARFTRTPAAAWMLGAATVAAFAVVAAVQVRNWKDSETLFRHAIKVTERNAVAYNNLGSALVAQERFAEGKAAFAQALEIDPKFASAHANLGSLLRQMGDMPTAAAHLQVALGIHPEDPVVHNDLGTVLDGMGESAAALEQYEIALRLAPDFAGAEYNLAETLARLGRIDDAIAHYQGALRNEPRNVSAHYNLAMALAQSGRFDAARDEYLKALEIDPTHIGAQNNLGTLLIRLGQAEAAIPHLQAVVSAKPDFPAAHYSLGKAFAASGRAHEALAQYREALRLKPEWVVAMNDLAWLLATAPQENVRNGWQAVELAERVCALSGRGQPSPLATLAAAYAEAGQFTQAVATAQAAYELVANSATPQLTNALGRQLESYRVGKAFHETVSTNLGLPK